MSNDDMIEVAYVRDSDEEFGTLKLCSYFTCFKNTYEVLLEQAFKKEKIDIDILKYLKTFQSKGDRYISDYIYFDEQLDRYKIDIDLDHCPVLRDKFNKNEYTLFRTSKHKTQIYNFISLENKPKSIRLFYNSITDDFIIVDCTMEEMETMYEELVTINKITIQDYEKKHITTTVFDVRTFITKEFERLKRKPTNMENVPYYILLSEKAFAFKQLYKFL